jgi:hypothetical protein
MDRQMDVLSLMQFKSKTALLKGCNIDSNNKKYLDFHAKCPNLILNKSGPSQHTYMKILNIKFHGNPSSGSHTETCRQTDRRLDGQTS